MRKAKRNAVKLEARVQALGLIKVAGAVDERSHARKLLANGLSGRHQKGERVPKLLVTTVAVMKRAGMATV